MSRLLVCAGLRGDERSANLAAQRRRRAHTTVWTAGGRSLQFSICKKSGEMGGASHIVASPACRLFQCLGQDVAERRIEKVSSKTWDSRTLWERGTWGAELWAAVKKQSERTMCLGANKQTVGDTNGPPLLVSWVTPKRSRQGVEGICPHLQTTHTHTDDECNTFTIFHERKRKSWPTAQQPRPKSNKHQLLGNTHTHTHTKLLIGTKMLSQLALINLAKR